MDMDFLEFICVKELVFLSAVSPPGHHSCGHMGRLNWSASCNYFRGKETRRMLRQHNRIQKKNVLLDFLRPFLLFCYARIHVLSLAQRYLLTQNMLLGEK